MKRTFPISAMSYNWQCNFWWSDNFAKGHLQSLYINKLITEKQDGEFGWSSSWKEEYAHSIKY